MVAGNGQQWPANGSNGRQRRDKFETHTTSLPVWGQLFRQMVGLFVGRVVGQRVCQIVSLFVGQICSIQAEAQSVLLQRWPNVASRSSQGRFIFESARVFCVSLDCIHENLTLFIVFRRFPLDSQIVLYILSEI